MATGTSGAAGAEPAIVRRATPHGSGPGGHHRLIEQTIALLHWLRRLRIRCEIRDDIHEAFMDLATATIICWRGLTH
ncbi:hypothetical protein FH608_005570 [Nonomuraea phyllanthi]|uniref:Transposase n=1 Tax=Nonomuraea phyllanthi TaxID=2219224 RepID=A0A5C4WSF6_9ACTN|nr:hypothetical protein [Nonomuraea phyllanthi]KAB8196244.1 hypothetical protein FH608_005570 [Nonomuraea phyllanthi]